MVLLAWHLRRLRESWPIAYYLPVCCESRASSMMKDELVASVKLCALLLCEGAPLKVMGDIRAWGAVETGFLSDLMLT